MLERLLAEIEKGGTQNCAGLASRLNTSPVLIEMMLEELERHGRVRRVSTSCDTTSKCGGCPTASNCSPQGRVWVLPAR
jgi:hypothetical protein